MPPLATKRSRSVSRSRSAHVTPQPVDPTKRGPSSARTSLEGRLRRVRRQAAVDGVGLSSRVRDEEIAAPVPVVVGAGDAHPAQPGRRHPQRPPAPRSESRSRPGPRGAARPRNVLVETVRVRVVRQVDVEVAVAVEVGHGDAEPILEPGDLEPRLDTDFPEGHAPVGASVAQVEQVSAALVRVREAECRARDRLVQVGVARDDEVRPPVPVDVACRCASVPAEGVDAGSTHRRR